MFDNWDTRDGTWAGETIVMRSSSSEDGRLYTSCSRRYSWTSAVPEQAQAAKARAGLQEGAIPSPGERQREVLQHLCRAATMPCHTEVLARAGEAGGAALPGLGLLPSAQWLTITAGMGCTRFICGSSPGPRRSCAMAHPFHSPWR